MSDTLASLRPKLLGARKLSSVVRAMKAAAATSIGQYVAAIEALEDYASDAHRLWRFMSFTTGPAAAAVGAHLPTSAAAR